MEENKKRVPELRFPEFTDEWEERKFEDIFKVSQGLQIPISNRYKESGDKRYFYITNEFLKDSCEEAYYIDSPPENVICDKDDILMTRTGNTGIVVTDVQGCFHNNFFKIRYDKNIFFKRYIYYLLSSTKMQKTILNSAGSSTIPDLSHKSFYRIYGMFPSFQEQIKIGQYFYNLDQLIILHQCKLEHWKEVKKGLLQKMFPKKGSNVPEIRFPEFTDEWEQRKLGEYLVESKIKGNTGDRAKKITVKLWGKGVVEKNDFGGSEHTQYYIRKSGQFIYSKLDFLNAAFGVIPENLDEYESTADLPAFDLLNMNPYFLLYRVIQEDFYLKNGTIADGSRKAKRIHVDTFLKMSLNVPSLIEQERIKDCLITVDNLITLHQRKLDHLKEIKKGLLQKMFV